jgi:hypothetical protein
VLPVSGKQMIHPRYDMQAALGPCISRLIGSGGIKQQEREADQSSASNAEITSIYKHIVNFESTFFSS